jgi:hypothetical protein
MLFRIGTCKNENFQVALTKEIVELSYPDGKNAERKVVSTCGELFSFEGQSACIPLKMKVVTDRPAASDVGTYVYTCTEEQQVYSCDITYTTGAGTEVAAQVKRHAVNS